MKNTANYINVAFEQNLSTSYHFPSGISLNIMDWQITEQQPGIYHSEDAMAELHYCLLGKVDATVNGEQLHINQNQLLLSYMPYVQMEANYEPNQTLKCISISFTEQSYNQLIAARFPEHRLNFRQMLGKQAFASIHCPLDAQILVLLQQLLYCPYHQSLKSLYMESKMLELIAASIEFVLLGDHKLKPTSQLRGDELVKIRLARDIIEKQMACPPSLLELAHLIGLNDNKLKSGFKEVYGMTVFGYLRQYRMEKALALLCDNYNVSETAWAIGYSNLSHFATLFRSHYGINPSEVRQQLSVKP